MIDALDLLDGTAPRAPDDEAWHARLRDDPRLTVRTILAMAPALVEFPGTLFDLARLARQRDPAFDDAGLPEVVREALAAADADDLDGVRALAVALDAVAPDSTRPNALAGTEPAAPQRSSWPTIPGFAILGVLGRGGMGVVYLARQLRLDRLVALKTMNARATASPGHRLRFLAEAEAIARLQHPGIVPLYEIREVDGETIFTLEYCPGGSLARAAAVPAVEAATVVAGLAEAVAHAHAHGIVHRDIKPENVLKSADGSYKLADFGLAHRLDESRGLTGTGDVVGTPAYMAPEQADPRGRPVGPAVDVYGLGALLSRLLTGKPPFDGATPAAIYHAVLNDTPVSLPAGTPRDLSAIVATAMAKEPRHRYATAAALAADLRSFVAGRPVVARPVPAMVKLWRWALRHRAAAAAIAITVVSSLAIAGLAMATAATARRNATLEGERATAKAVADQRAADAVDAAYRELQEERTKEARARLDGIDDESVSASVRDRLSSCRRDIATVEKLGAVYLSDADTESMQKAHDDDYESVLRDGGYPILSWSIDEVRDVVRASPIRRSITAGITRWVLHGDFSDANPDRMKKLHAVMDRLTGISERKPFRDLIKLCERAESHAELAVQLDGADGQTWHTMAMVAHAFGHPAFAASLIRRAAAESPNDFHVLMNAAKIHVSQGPATLALAKGYVRAAVAVRPQSLGARLMLVQLATTDGPAATLAESHAARRAGLSHPKIDALEAKARAAVK